MIRPSKHSHPDRTVINVALIILVRLRKRRLDSYDKLLRVAKQATVGGDLLFLPAVSLLFLLGLVEYRGKTDAFEYTGP